MIIDTHNSAKIKLQGVTYYHDCYKFWDLNHCRGDFINQYQKVVDEIRAGRHRVYNCHNNMSVIHLGTYERNFNKYLDKLSKNVVRDIQIAEKKRFYFKEYNFNNHIYDYSEINFSQKKGGKKVNPWYLKDPEFYAGSHSGYRHEWEDDLHYSQWFGVFKYFKHYKQGATTTNEKLFAYCKVAIDGEMASIHLIWSNFNHRNDGVMFFLISNIVKKMMENKNVKIIVYYSHSQYPNWKSRILFEPSPLQIIL